MGLNLESLAEATSGAIGAVVSTTILYPLDTCKTKYQAEVRAHHQQKYRSKKHKYTNFFRFSSGSYLIFLDILFSILLVIFPALF